MDITINLTTGYLWWKKTRPVTYRGIGYEWRNLETGRRCDRELELHLAERAWKRSQRLPSDPLPHPDWCECDLPRCNEGSPDVQTAAEAGAAWIQRTDTLGAAEELIDVQTTQILARVRKYDDKSYWAVFVNGACYGEFVELAHAKASAEQVAKRR